MLQVITMAFFLTTYDTWDDPPVENLTNVSVIPFQGAAEFTIVESLEATHPTERGIRWRPAD